MRFQNSMVHIARKLSLHQSTTMKIYLLNPARISSNCVMSTQAGRWKSLLTKGHKIEGPLEKLGDGAAAYA